MKEKFTAHPPQQTTGILALLSLCLMLHPGQVFSTGEKAAEYLKLGLSPKAEAAATGIAAIHDVSGFNYNPAGLGTISSFAIGLQNLFLFDNMNSISLEAAIPVLWGSLGVSFSYFSSGSFPEQLNGVYQGQLGASMFMLNAGYAQKIFADIVAGASIKFFSENFAGVTGSSIALDVGACRDFTVKKLFVWSGTRLSAALSVKNLGLPVNNSGLPLSFIPAMEYGIFDFKGNRINLMAESDLVLGDKPGFNLGLAYSFTGLVTVQLGYKFNQDSRGLTAGLGFKLRNFELDYAFLPMGELGINHLIGISVDIGDFFRSNKEKK